MTPQIRPMTPDDWSAVRAVYQEGIATGEATFERTAPEWDAWDAGHLSNGRLVAETKGVVGWAALSPVSSRCVYAGVAEVSVYVGEQARGQGIGRALLAALASASERDGIWTLQAGVFAGDAASVALHQRCSFRVVGTRERLGELDGRWRDVVLLERRSQTVGAEPTV